MPGDAQASAIGQGLEAGRDVHGIAVDAIAVDDDLADVDADPELEPAPLGQLGVALAEGSWISTAHSTASTTLANSASRLSPGVSTTRPWKRAMGHASRCGGP